MARKRKDEKGDENYDVLIGFIKTFTFLSEDDVTRLSGHPKEGRIYRLLKDPYGWRLHLGRETNNEGLDGLFLGALDLFDVESGQIKGEHNRYSFDIRVVTPANYLELHLTDEDREKLFSWIEADNSDLWENLKKEQKGESSVIRSGMDLLKVLMTQQGNGAVVKQTIHGASSMDKERALEATLTLLTHFKNKPVDQLLALYDGMFPRILNTLEN